MVTSHPLKRKEMIFIDGNAKITADEIVLLVPKNLINNTDISHYAITVYCLIKKLSFSSCTDIQCITLQQLIFYLTGEIPNRRSAIYDHIQQGLSDLVENDYIEIKDVQQKHYILNCENLWFDTGKESFVNVFYSDVLNILKIEGVNNHRLLRYYIFLMGTMNGNIKIKLPSGISKKGVVSDMAIGYLSDRTGISQKTIMEYNKLLEETKVLYIYRFAGFIINHDSIKNSHNVYGRYTDKEYVDAYVKNKQNRTSKKQNAEIDIDEVNDKRRLSQMYKAICLGQDLNYSKHQILKVYKYIETENEKYAKLYDETRNITYLNKLRDMSVFKKYLME